MLAGSWRSLLFSALDLPPAAVYAAALASGLLGAALGLLASALTITRRSVRAGRWLAAAALVFSGLGLAVRLGGVEGPSTGEVDPLILAPLLGLALAVVALWASFQPGGKP